MGGRFEPNINHSLHPAFEPSIHPNIFYRRNRHNNCEPIIWDRTTTSYVIKKSSCRLIHSVIVNLITNFFAIDHMFAALTRYVSTADFFPHLFYSPYHYDTDIQRDFNFMVFKDGITNINILVNHFEMCYRIGNLPENIQKIYDYAIMQY